VRKIIRLEGIVKLRQCEMSDFRQMPAKPHQGSSANLIHIWLDGAGPAVVAAFIKLEDGAVHLRRSDGKIAAVPLERMSKQGRAYVAAQAKRSVSP
jgi:hypothetical protein